VRSLTSRKIETSSLLSHTQSCVFGFTDRNLYFYIRDATLILENIDSFFAMPNDNSRLGRSVILTLPCHDHSKKWLVTLDVYTIFVRLAITK
jgi:hypothetical protein